MINLNDLSEYVISPTLEKLKEYHKAVKSTAAENLLLWTALVESVVHGDMHLRQLNDGPAMGIWQMERATHDDLWNTFIDRRSNLSVIMRELATHQHYQETVPAEELYGNLQYACAMARLKYWRVPAPLPGAWDIQAQAEYWKRWYNTNPDHYESDINRFINMAQDFLT